MKILLGLLIVVTLQTPCSLQTSPRSLALWTVYTDKIVTTCIEYEYLKNTRLLFGALANCINHQRRYLHCLPEEPAVSTTYLTTPCGWINSSQDGNSHSLWNIKIHHQFSLLATFHEFNLPFPDGSCDKLQGSETLVLKKGETDNNQTKQDSTRYLCGKRSLFSLKWPNNELVLNYREEADMTFPGVLFSSDVISWITERSGHFILKYQVCEGSYTVNDVIGQVITHSTLAKRTDVFTLTVGDLKHNSVSSKRTTYSVHFLGERLRVLDLSLSFQNISERAFQVSAFEGPGSAEIYQHPDQDAILLGETIYFISFQGFVEIKCVQLKCRNLYLHYIWSLVHDFSKTVILDGEFTINYPNGFCAKDYEKLLYCAYILMGPHRLALRITFDHLSFKGSDFLGSQSGQYQCIFAGVAVADKLRYEILQQEDFVFPFITDGDTSREFVTDAIFPEFQHCSRASKPKTYQNQLEFPTDSIVSTSRGLVLVLYAYEEYVEKFSLKLTVTPTSCIGVITGCYEIPGDAYAQIAPGLFYTWESRFMMKLAYCKNDNFLFIDIPALHSTDVHISLKLTFCTDTARHYTSIRILSSLASSGDGRCVELHSNPHSRLKESLWCNMFDDDIWSQVKHKIDRSGPWMKSVYCRKHSNETLDWKQQGIGEYDVIMKREDHHLLNALNWIEQFQPKCWLFVINVTMPCHSTERIKSVLSDALIQQDLQRYKRVHVCPESQTTFVSSNTTTRVYMKQLGILGEIDNYRRNGKQYGLVAKSYLSWTLGQSELTLTVSVKEQCPDHCRKFELHFTYIEPVDRGTVILQWQLLFSDSKQSIVISQLPTDNSAWLLYATQIAMLGVCKKDTCDVEIIKSVTNDPYLGHNLLTLDHPGSSVFAHYVLLWTSDDYSWYEAEQVCTQMDMHLASITSQEEYQLVTGMLSGEGYRTEFHHESRILTPCKTVSYLCTIYIGMLVKVKTSSLYLKLFKEFWNGFSKNKS